MNREDVFNKFPKTIYDNLQDETKYECEGSCTCKYIKNRTDFDINQFKKFEDGKNTVLPRLKNTISSNSRGWLSA